MAGRPGGVLCEAALHAVAGAAGHLLASGNGGRGAHPNGQSARGESAPSRIMVDKVRGVPCLGETDPITRMTKSNNSSCLS